MHPSKACISIEVQEDKSPTPLRDEQFWNALSPIFVQEDKSEVRKQVLSLLELNSFSNTSEKSGLYYLVYSFLPQLFVLLVAVICCLVRKQWCFLLVLLGVIGKVPLIFITAPSRLFMYYYGIYVIGTVVLIYGIFWLYSRRKEKPKQA